MAPVAVFVTERLWPVVVSIPLVSVSTLVTVTALLNDVDAPPVFAISRL
jgi:hypothetical protein